MKKKTRKPKVIDVNVSTDYDCDGNIWSIYNKKDNFVGKIILRVTYDDWRHIQYFQILKIISRDKDIVHWYKVKCLYNSYKPSKSIYDMDVLTAGKWDVTSIPSEFPYEDNEYDVICYSKKQAYDEMYQRKND